MALRYAGNSFYDALLAGVTKKMSHGLEFQGSFTWGKSIDNSSGHHCRRYLLKRIVELALV